MLAQVVCDHVINLTLHEAESYICIPEIVVAAAAAIGSQEVLITLDEVTQIIFDELRHHRLPIALKRTFSESTFTVRISLERSVLSSVGTKEEAMIHIRAKAEEEVSKAVEAMSEDVFEAKLDRELAVIDKALDEQDVLTALRIVPGKQLLTKLAPRTGCKNGTDLMRSIKRNLSVATFEPVKCLSDALNASLARQGVVETREEVVNAASTTDGVAAVGPSNQSHGSLTEISA